MKIAFATSECVPYVKTGGLADVGGALPKALAQAGCEVKVFLPLYGSISTLDHELILAEELRNIQVRIGSQLVAVNIWYGKLPQSQVAVYFIDCPHYYHRRQPYTNDPDEDERFILLQHTVIQILQRYNWAPDIVHCNDWHTGLLPALLKLNYNWDHLFSATACILSIHNIGYQGRFGRESVGKAGLPYDQYYPGGPLEFDDSFCFLKTGIMYSEIISTVSETYAHEIQTAAYGAGMEGVLAARSSDLSGILNGIDTEVWNPQKDKLIPHRYSARSLARKKKNKQALLEQAKLPFDEDVAVLGIVTRLTKQKGIELLQPIIHEVMQLPLQIVALGSGEKELEDFLKWAALTYKDKFSACIGYDNELAHLITAGADMFLMPSLYEPCGLNQMYSLNYGTVPIVRKTGGLADTVKDYHEYYGEGNGLAFNDFTPHALYLTILRARDLFQNKQTWHEIMQRGMRQDFSWQASAKRYIELYKKAKVRHADL